jgi:hypothetical protein
MTTPQHEDVPSRLIVTLPRGKDGLFIQPETTGPDRERDEQHNRDRFASHFKFADLYTGNTRTFDEQGDYNCGRCNQADGKKCLLVKIASIDRDAGSCGDWETIDAGDPEMTLHEKSPEVASYGVAANGKGFGCHRCPYALRAHEPDSLGRDLYCAKGDFRTFNTACCALNGAPLKKADGPVVHKHAGHTTVVASRKGYT